jgi:hypothetical protein
MLVTGFTLGQLVTVTFDNKVFKIIDYMYKGSLKQPFKFIIILINEYGGIENCGNKVVKDLYSNKRMYSEYERLYRIFNVK